MSPLSTVFGFLVYAAFMAGLFWLAFLQRKKRREGRFPVPEDTLAMRRAGEQLSADLARLDEKFECHFLMLLVLPVLGLAAPLLLATSWKAANPAGVLVAAAALPLAAVIFGVKKLLKTTERIRDSRLALYGERLVGDQLMSLTDHGYAVFHDVPCLGGGGRFNLDHVVVGNGAVCVVETKTYRKRAGVNGEAHKVSYDGQKLVWPDGTSTDELEQVMRAAEWLRNDLKKHLNLEVPVRAALTMPGWYVKGGPPQAPVLVENPKRLPHFIRERFQGSLKRDQEDLVRRHLRSLCETVSYEEMPV
ncbi:MAG: NERD domain-containing protein [Prosthecobacter sp.]|jgi:hypothetical protein|uniref:nuclease-related domain-containing protein n=1 Tax=Prosthecobacter sp. TaxID=1965333 RepID=UPI0019E954FD|nr:nuclease-related domain-containing protein [Prosthecobacter sp.]MBE2282124.1 NERD domain-containing protein [Prosthecobacter sp.]